VVVYRFSARQPRRIGILCPSHRAITIGSGLPGCASFLGCCNRQIGETGAKRRFRTLKDIKQWYSALPPKKEVSRRDERLLRFPIQCYSTLSHLPLVCISEAEGLTRPSSPARMNIFHEHQKSPWSPCKVVSQSRQECWKNKQSY
jgi:hypothetical protein